MMQTIEIKCVDRHTFRMLSEYVGSKYDIRAYGLKNLICVCARNESEAEAIFDDVAYQLDCWCDLNAEMELV